MLTMSYGSREFGSPLAMQEAVSKAMASILEIGAGRYFPEVLDKKTVRVGLNIDPRQHELLCEQTGMDKPNCFAVFFDLRTLDGSNQDTADRQQKYFMELFGNIGFTSLRFTNVFGEHNTKQQFRKDPRVNPTGNDYRGASTDEQKLSSLRLATGLLVPGGKLTINEFVTPSMGLAPRLLINPRLLEELGYEDITPILFEGQSIHDDSPPFRITATKI